MSPVPSGRPRRIVVYDDAYAFGGHELMVCRLLEGLRDAGDFEILALFSPENRRRLEEGALADGSSNRLRVEFLPFSNPRRFGNLAALLSPAKVAHVLRRLRSFSPDAVLVAQGGIDTSVVGLLAARLGGYRSLSYIPNLNGYCRTNPTVKNRLRDHLNRPFHRLPREFVVIREGHRDELRALGFRGKVHIVYNAVDAGCLARIPRQEARTALDLPPGAQIMGLVGRIDLANKGHALVAEAMESHPEAFRNSFLLVVGEGPDEARFREIVREKGLDSTVRVLGFRRDLSPIYSALDMVLIPSLSEGVPLVMIEALHYGLPVVATAIDGMKEMLPPGWLFRPGDAAALAGCISWARGPGGTAPGGWNREQMLARFDPARFLQSFRAALG